MTQSSSQMQRPSIASLFLLLLAGSLLLGSCKKTEEPDLNFVSKHSSEVLDKWMTMQLRLMRNTTGVSNQAFSRYFVYAGIAAQESIKPGLPKHSGWSFSWNNFTSPPSSGPGSYFYPANVNAAMATINKALFPNASIADKAAIDSLEAAFNSGFLETQPEAIIKKSLDFGRAVATAVFNWAETDGYKKAGNAYTPPTGDGLWVPTAPSYTPAVAPYWGDNRITIVGSNLNSQPDSATSYSTDPHSQFYQMVKYVYDVSQNLTQDQKDIAFFWRDVPGVSSPGHWLSILQQVIRKTNTRLDKAAVSYALTGAAINDALISCWKTKYTYNLQRPITYIRNIMGHASWNPLINTPSFPEYSSAHASLSGAAAVVLNELFGNIGAFTDHTYDYMGFPSRTYTSFSAIADEAAKSRIYAGIHYQPSAEAGLRQGKKVAANILSRLGRGPGKQGSLQDQ